MSIIKEFQTVNQLNVYNPTKTKYFLKHDKNKSLKVSVVIVMATGRYTFTKLFDFKKYPKDVYKISNSKVCFNYLIKLWFWCQNDQNTLYD